MNILTISSLYPNKNDPKLGIFVKTRLMHLKSHFPETNVKVIAPVPWFPFSHPIFGTYAKYANVPYHEVIDGIDVYHPKYPVIPKLGMFITPIFMARAIKSAMKKLLKTYVPDIIDGHYFYPDGVAIQKACEQFDIPFTCTARGTDINLIPQYPLAKKMIQQVFKKADHLMAVCNALSDEMIDLGAPKDKVTTLRNGVDLKLFPYGDEIQQQKLRSKLNMPINQPILLSVGWLIERKGHHLIIEAMNKIDNTHLYIAGDGPDEKLLQDVIDKHNLNERVTLVGSLTQTQLSEYFRAVDVTVLASSREGWANVLLESMASGTPVVATKVWGTPEVVQTDEVGELVERKVEDIANGVNALLDRKTPRAEVRRYAEQFDWLETSKGQYRIFRNITERAK